MKANEINYGGVTFKDYQEAASTVCRYLDGLTNTHQIHDKLTEEAMKTLTVDSMMGFSATYKTTTRTRALHRTARGADDPRRPHA